MKRTTYIMIGMLMAGVAAICGVVFYMSLGPTWEDSFMEIGGSRKTVQLPSCRVVKLEAPVTWKQKRAGIVEAERAYSFRQVPLTVTSGDSLKGSLSYAGDMDSFMSITAEGDTLSILFKFPEDRLEERFRDVKWLKLHSEEMVLALPAGVQTVLVGTESMETTFKNLRCDTLLFCVEDLARVEECHITSLSAQARTLRFHSGEVRDLHLNLDEISDWRVNVDSFRIDTEHLSGCYRHSNSLQKGECRQVLWTPLTEDALLQVTMPAGRIELDARP